MSQLDDRELLTVLQTRRDHCRELLDLSRQQRGLIDNDDYTRLLDVLGQKQRILGRLDEINQRYPDIRAQWHAKRDAMDAPLREDCEGTLADAEALLAELIREEKESTDYLTKRRDETQAALKSISHGTKVNQAYEDSLAPATHRHLSVDK